MQVRRFLAAIAKNRVQPMLGQAKPCGRITCPLPLQQQALDLLGLGLERTQCRISANGRWFEPTTYVSIRPGSSG